MSCITYENNLITIQTKNSTYAMLIKFGTPLHLYYGQKIESVEGIEKHFPQGHRSFGVYFKEFGKEFYPSTFPLEVSFYDYGDFRTPSVTIKGDDGKYISDFEFDHCEITDKRRVIEIMPYGRDCDNGQNLAIFLKSRDKDVFCVLNYAVYPDIDVIARNVEIINNTNQEIVVEKCSSALIDFNESGFNMLTLHGLPANERKRHIQPVPYGRYKHSSVYGTTGSYGSPFTMLMHDADENHGSVYGVNLVYSGNFAIETDLSDMEVTRLSIGINPDFFAYRLKANETFYSPEALLTYSDEGFNGVSINYADYTRSFIMPERFAKNPRPVVINTWEALIFDINEQKLLDFADVAVKANLDTLVIDDGWFSIRRWDDKGLGDWWVCEELFPSGLQKFSEKITEKGIGLGIWIEPEMVNPDSELYRTHPEWALGKDDRLLSRSQLVLDMTNPEVVDYIFNVFKKTFEGVKLSYIKWDMNRSICPFLSSYTKDNKEVAHRYMLGVYTLMEKMTSHFKDVLFESCSGGGGRYDLAMLHYTPQIWTSDNTDPFERSYIQAGASYFTPLSAMSCHVTRPFNIGTRLGTSLEFRYGMALNGVLGYEFDLFKLSEQEIEAVKEQVAEYKRLQDFMLLGDFYRLQTPFEGNIYSYAIVSKDKNKAILSINIIRNGRGFPDLRVKIFGLDDEKNYLFDGNVYKGQVLKNSGIRIPDADCSGQTFRYEIVAVD